MTIKIAVLCCTNVVGGHELQTVSLARSLAQHAMVTVCLNSADHASLFNISNVYISICNDQLLRPGNLVFQFFDGWRRRNTIRHLVRAQDYVIVSAGAVEAGIATGVALRNYRPISMYLPSFYDRVTEWGWIGNLYNCMLSNSCKLFKNIITINRIQAKVIRAFCGVHTYVVPNNIRDINISKDEGPARLIYIGRLDSQKRVEELIEWLNNYKNPIKELILIGDGPLRLHLEQKAITLTYLKCTFLGWQEPDAQDRIIRRTDVLLLNSLIEGEPLVIREARLRGMRILVRDIMGTRGVTSRSERFKTKSELLQKLTNFSNLKLPPIQLEGNNYIQREMAIEKIIKIVSDEISEFQSNG